MIPVELTSGLLLLVMHNQGTRIHFPIIERSEFCRVALGTTLFSERSFIFIKQYYAICSTIYSYYRFTDSSTYG
jgi:hypothetical protein